VILDEVHAYDTYTGHLLERLIEWLGASGTTVILLSATLPSKRRLALLNAYRRGAKYAPAAAQDCAYPRISIGSPNGLDVESVAPRAATRMVRIDRASEDIEEIASRVAAEVRVGGCVGWVCNTVARAQKAAQVARRLLPDLGERLLLVHSRLFPPDRD